MDSIIPATLDELWLVLGPGMTTFIGWAALLFTFTWVVGAILRPFRGK